MDEVFDSSLDGFGTYEFLKIIRYVIKGANTFIISHKDGLQDKFDNVIQFEKVKRIQSDGVMKNYDEPTIRTWSKVVAGRGFDPVEKEKERKDFIPNTCVNVCGSNRSDS